MCAVTLASFVTASSLPRRSRVTSSKPNAPVIVGQGLPSDRSPVVAPRAGLQPESAHDSSQEQETQFLEAARNGEQSAADQLLPLVYDELRALAASFFRGQRPDHTLQPTALVHEAYARMVKPSDRAGFDPHLTSRAHFFAVAATAMRQVLANHARDRRAAKRGGEARHR